MIDIKTVDSPGWWLQKCARKLEARLPRRTASQHGPGKLDGRCGCANTAAIAAAVMGAWVTGLVPA